MIVNILKKIYMIVIKLYSSVICNFKTQKKIIYLMSFPDNNNNLLEKLIERKEVVVYYTNETAINREYLNALEVEYHSLNNLYGLKRAVRDVTRSQITICDNYFPFLGAIKKKENRLIFQIWHATGAIKCFGLEDKQLLKRSNSDRKRFNDVYKSFDYYIVASKAMGEVFKRSYGASEDQLLYLGFPRTDALFLDKPLINRKSKKIILYLPTYRENQKELPPFDPEIFKEKYKNDYQLVIKLHPHITGLAKDKINDDFVIWQTSRTTESWLKEADILITDYSSVAYDYALINPKGKLIFYWYDEKDYQYTTGIQSNVKETIPSKICYNEKQIIEVIEDEEKNDLTSFNKVWNTYNDGKVIDRVVEMILEIGE